MPESNKSTRGDEAAESEDEKTLVHLDVSWLTPADLRAVDALARLQIAAGRCGRSLCLHGADERLVGLVDITGLRHVLGMGGCQSQQSCLDEGLRDG